MAAAGPPLARFLLCVFFFSVFLFLFHLLVNELIPVINWDAHSGHSWCHVARSHRSLGVLHVAFSEWPDVTSFYYMGRPLVRISLT